MASPASKVHRAVLALLGGASVLWAVPAFAQQYPPGSVVQPLPNQGRASELRGHLRALAANPRSLSALVGAGRAAVELGDYQAALTFFNRARDVAPSDPRPLAGLGSVLIHMEQPEDALRYFTQAADAGAPEAEIAGDRGLAYDAIGDQARAQTDYNLALGRRDDPEIRRRLALSLGISGQREAALRTIADQLARQDRAALRVRIFVLALTGDSAGAAQSAQGAMPPSAAAALTPFLQRLPVLTPAQRAMAVHFGRFPTGVPMRMAEASPVRTPPVPAPAPRASPPPPPPPPVQRRQEPAPVRVAPPPRATPAPTPAPPSGSRIVRRFEPEPGSLVGTVRQRPRPVQRQPVEAAQAQPQAAPPPTTVPRPQQQPVQIAQAAQQPVVQTPAPQPPVPVPAPVQPQPQPPAPVQQPPVAAPETQTEPIQLDRPLTIASPLTPQTAQPGFGAPEAPPATAPAAQPRSEARPGRLEEVAALVSTLPPDPQPPSAAPQRQPERPAVSTERPAATPARNRAAPATPQRDRTAAATQPRQAAPTPAPRTQRQQPAREVHSSRHWVQVGIGADRSALPSTFSRIGQQAPALLRNRNAYVTQLRATNRLLVGPFPTFEAAQAFVNQLARENVSAFAWTSPEGQEVERLPAR
jgi:Flp pilus assembly protein TadD